MKKTLLILLFLLLVAPCSEAVSPTVYQMQTTGVKAVENVEDSIFSTVIAFFAGIFKQITGQNTQPIVTSQNVDLLSNTIKHYQNEEKKNNPNYENSPSEDKTNFGIGLLNLIANILKIFGV